jgi:hypothetical protein
MPADPILDRYLRAAAEDVREIWERKAIVLVFRPGDPPEDATLYSDAAAVDLLPVLRAMVTRVESGALRMPVSADGVRWVGEGEGT